MNAGGRKRLRSDINVTPLVDVVLVLLVIFIVMTPMMKAGYDVDLPAPASLPPTLPKEIPVVVRILATGEIFLNQEAVAPVADFPARIRELVRTRRPDRVFVSVENAVPYADAVRVLDVIRDSGEAGRAVPIGLVLPGHGGAGEARRSAP